MVVIKPLLHKGVLCIALYFTNNKATEAMVRSFDGRKFSITHRCWYLPFSETTLAYVLEKIKTVDTVTLADNNEQDWPLHILTGTSEKHEVVLPDSFIKTLIRLRYSTATQMNYCAQFKAFLAYIAPAGVETFGDTEINGYLHYLVTTRKVSRSTQNQAINAIKFYLEHVKHGERKVYYVDRPIKELKLPTILSEEEMQRLLFYTRNIKHKCLLLLLYSGGLRISEVLKLMPADIDVDRKVIYVRGAKGNKDRITLLSAVALTYLQQYLAAYKPVTYIFEGPDGAAYSSRSVNNIIKRSALLAGIIKSISAHTLRHTFATHLLEHGTDLRYIQSLLGHESSKTTERYTQVTRKGFAQIVSPLDNLLLKITLPETNNGI